MRQSLFSASWFVKLLLVITLLITPVFAARTFYIDPSGGADTNNGTATGTPWAHLPGDSACSNTCAATTPTGDDSYILKGGTTYSSVSSAVRWHWAGTSGHTIYIGVDKTWFAGGSWTRPIMTCSLTAHCGFTTAGGNTYAQIYVDTTGGFLVIDNIEFTGLYIGATGTDDQYGVFVAAANVEIKNCYWHGWNHAASAVNRTLFLISTYNGGSPLTSTNYHDNVFDGSDSSKDMTWAVANGDSVQRNIFLYVAEAIDGTFNTISDNYIVHTVASYTGAHCDTIQHAGPQSGTTALVYNNYLGPQDCGGGTTLGLTQLPAGSACVGCNTYAWNNVVNDPSPKGSEPLIGIGGHASSACDFGTFWVYGNTIYGGANDAIGNTDGTQGACGSVSRSTVHHAMNHYIGTGSLCVGPGTTCTNDGGTGTTGSLIQTVAQAATHYAAASAALAFAPLDASAEGIAQGLAGNSSAWTTFAAAAGTTSLSDTTYGCTDVSNVSTCPANTAVLRPTTATKIDVGAFMYSGAVTAPTCTLSAAPAVIKTGTSSTLTFAVANTPTVCSIDNGIGNVSCSGATTSVSPTTATTYTATVTNAGGSNTCTATVSIGGVKQAGNVIRTANTVMQ